MIKSYQNPKALNLDPEICKLTLEDVAVDVGATEAPHVKGLVPGFRVEDSRLRVQDLGFQV